jgi:hypothetical protein
MKTLEEIKKIINSHRNELDKRFKVKSIGLFGSYVKGEETSGSDIDILVEFKEPVGFLFIHLANYLEEILGIKVDLLTSEAIKPNRKRYIMEELIYV